MEALITMPMEADADVQRNFAVTSVRCVNPLEIPNWDHALEQHGEATIFHSAAWARVLQLSFGYRPMYVAAYRGDDLVAVLPLMEVRSGLTGARGISLPFTDSCGPLGRDLETGGALYGEALRLGKTHGWRYVEFRKAWGGADGEPPPVTSIYCEHMLDVSSGLSEVRARFHPSISTSLRDARSEGIETTVDASLGSLQTFDRLNAYSRTKNGLPTQPYAFLRHLHHEVLEAGHGFVVIARLAGRPIAAGIFLHFGRHAVHKYGALGRGCPSNRVYNLVLWEGIRACAKKGAKEVSLGRSATGELGVCRRNRAWGTEENEVQYVRVDPRTGSKVMTVRDGMQTLPNRILRVLPVPTARLAGSILYRHFA